MRLEAQKHPYSVVACLIAFAMIMVAGSLAAPRRAVSAGTPVAISGYLWSDTIGWADMNCTNTAGSGCTSFGVSIDSSGNLAGYAWSENVGWIKFGGLSAFPPSGTQANALLTGTALTGWARACAGTLAGDCSSMTSRTDGWDGWILLDGVTLQSNGYFSGYAWGSSVVGWVDFSYASTINVCAIQTTCGCANSTTITIATVDASCNVTNSMVTCSAPQFCSPGSCVCLTPQPTIVGDLTVTPNLVQKSGTTTVSWDVANANCTVTGTNNDGTVSSTNTVSPGVWSSPGAGANTKTSSPILTQTVYTMTCVGASTVTQTAAVNVAPIFQEK